MEIVDKIRLIEFIVSEPRFTPQEKEFLTAGVHMRSVRWGTGKTNVLKIRDFILGNKYHAPLMMSERTVSRIISSLVRKGVLIVERFKYGARYAINLAWEFTMSGLKFAKKPKEKDPSAPPKLAVPRRPAPPKMSPPIVETTLSFLSTALSLVPPAQPPSSAPVEEKKESRIEEEKPMVEKEELGLDYSEPRINEVKPYKIWFAAMKDTYPEYGATKFGIIENSIAKRLSKRVDKNTDPLVLLDWCVRNWKSVMCTEFMWMKKYPEYPDIKFLSRHLEKFNSWYHSREIMPRYLKTLSKDERVIQHLKDVGHSQEEAERRLMSKREKQNAAKVKEDLAVRHRESQQFMTAQLKVANQKIQDLQIEVKRAVRAAPIVPVEIPEDGSLPIPDGEDKWF